MNDLTSTASLIDSIVVFSSVARGNVLTCLRKLLLCGEGEERVKLYSDFVSAIYAENYDFGKYLLNAVCEDENEYVILRSKNCDIPAVLKKCVERELKIFESLSRISPRSLRGFVSEADFLPDFESTACDFSAEYEKKMTEIRMSGYGIYARSIMFRVDKGEIIPLLSADTTTVDDLVGYELERQKIIDNTAALVAGRPAANTLLCGDAGTGKSSTVKAVANHFSGRGVRLIEMKKDQLREIPQIMEKLRDNPLKFIIFIDDLSFSKSDDNLGTLKAILEGSASVRSVNTVIYATSNRRHLVSETFADREGDEVHRQETMQELFSLSERFGLTVTFSKPGKELYLRIVRELAATKKIKISAEELDLKAEAFALRKGGRSARAAEQFTDSLLVAGDREE